MESLEARWVMHNGLAIEFIQDSGDVSFENGTKVLTVDPGATIDMDVVVTADVVTNARLFQLSFEMSDVETGELTLSDWMTATQVWQMGFGSFNEPTEYRVGGGAENVTATITSNPATPLGSFTLTAPQAGGDYLLTVAGVTGAFRSSFVNINGEPREIDEFNDVIIRVAAHVPEAVDDAYTFTQGTSFSRGASNGVLSNDIDLDGDTLTATLVSDVQHGQLTLNGDGSFTYTPISYYFGTDSFTYVANDGTDDSETATVTFTIQATTPWRNPRNPYDTDDDGIFKPLDILVIINRINLEGAPVVGLPAPGGSFGSPPPYYDVSGDNNMFPADVLIAINAINAGLTMPPEGEAAEGLFDGEGESDQAGLPTAAAAETESPIESPPAVDESAVAAPTVAPLPWSRRFVSRREAADLRPFDSATDPLEPLLDLLAEDRAGI